MLWHRSRIIFVSALLLLQAASALRADDVAAGSGVDSADAVWERLQEHNKYNKQMVFPGDASVLERNWQIDIERLQFRELGLHFWEEFPGDPRRYQWLLQTLLQPPAYIKDHAQAVLAEKKWYEDVTDDRYRLWKKRYEQELKPAFLGSPSTTAGERLQLCKQEMGSAVANTVVLRRMGKEVDMAGLLQTILANAALLPAADFKKIAGRIFEYEDLHVDAATRRQYIADLKNSANLGLRELGLAKERTMRLMASRDTPLELQLVALDGRKIDVASLRGKVVLLDFWALSCSSCIEEMERVKEVRARYQPLGFEVLGVVFGDESMKPAVEKLMRRKSIPWSQSLQELYGPDSLWNRFGFTAIGEQFVIDQKGYLVANELNDVSKLEPTIRKLLGLAAP